MTMKKTAAILALTAALTGALVGVAQAERMGAGGPMPELNFETIDANKDGKITTEEFAAFRKAEFAKADTNADGQISAEELTAMHLADISARAAEMSAKMIERLDENGDGQISAEEMEQGPRPVSMFERADADGDGAVTQAEVDAAMEKVSDRRGKHGRGGHDTN